MTNLENKEFFEQYELLTTEKRNAFSTICKKLLSVNFLVKDLYFDEYNFIISNISLFECFFKYLDIEFYLDADRELAYLKIDDESLGGRLNKNETIVLLVLRSLYQSKLDEVSLENNITITVKELHEKLFAVGFPDLFKERAKLQTLKDSLRKFRDHGIISYTASDLVDDDTYITIYSSIELVVDFKEMVEINARLSALNGGEEDE